MNQNLQARSKNLALSLAVLGLTGLIALLAALAAFQLWNLLIYIGILIVETPALRPPAWNSSTISGLSRCAVLILGMLWLGLVLFSHHYLGEAVEDRRLMARAGWLTLIIIGVYLFSAVLLYLLG